MNKDALLATLIGLVLGLTIAGAFIFGPRLLRALPRIAFPTISMPKITPKATPQPTGEQKEFTVTITAPLPEAVEPKDTIVVSGITGPTATVVIQGAIDEDVVVAGADGAYAGKITAAEGKNDVFVTAYSTEGKQAQSTVTIYYSEESF